MLDATPRQAAADALRAARSDRAPIDPLVERFPGADMHTPPRSATDEPRWMVGGRENELIALAVALAGRGDDTEARTSGCPIPF